MGVFDTPRFAAALLTLSLVLGVGCPPPPPGSSCTGCTVKKVRYSIGDYPEEPGASVTAVNMVEEVIMTGHCYDGTSTSPCTYTHTSALAPRTQGNYTECMTQATDSDDTITVTVNVVLTRRDGSTVTKDGGATLQGTCR